MSFAVLKELSPPSSVEAACWARLIAGSAESFLAVARGSVLDVFRLGAEGIDAAASSSLAAAVSQDAAQVASDGTSVPGVRLQVVTSLALSGRVASISAITLAGKAAEAVARRIDSSQAAPDGTGAAPLSFQALLLTFAPGRVALVGLDPFTLSLRTLGLLNFEPGAAGGPGCAVDVPLPSMLHQRGLGGLAQAAVDPLQRAVALPLFDDVVAVIPLRRGGGGFGGELEDDEDEGDGYAALQRATFGSAGAVAGAHAKHSIDAAADGTSAEGGAASEDALAVSAASSAMDGLTRRVLGRPYLVHLRDVGRRGGATSSSSSDALSGGDVIAAGSDGAASSGLDGELRDAAFLCGYRIEPALGVLVAKGVTNTSRLGSLGHNTTFAAVSVDATPGAPTGGSGSGADAGALRRSPVPLWRYDGLPHDAHASVPVPEPLGGVVIVSNNALLYLAQYSHCGLALNAYAAATVDCGKWRLGTNVGHEPGAARVCVSAEAGARLAFLTPHSGLLSLRGGEAYLLTLHMGGGGGGADVSHMTLTPTAIRGPPMPAGLALLRGAEVDAHAASLRHHRHAVGEGDIDDGARCGSGVELALKAAAAAADASAAPGSDGEAAPASLLSPPSSFGLLFSCGRISDSLLSLYALTPAGATSAAGGEGEGGADGNAAAADEDAGLYGGGVGAGGAAAGEAASFSFGGGGGNDGDDSALYGGAAPSSNAPTAAAAVEELDEDALLYGTAPAGSLTAASSSAAAAATAAAAMSVAAAGAEGGILTARPSSRGGAAPSPLSTLRLSLFPIDYLPCAAPSSGTVLGREAQMVDEDASEPPLSAPATEIVQSCGYGHAGRVVISNGSLRPTVISDLHLPTSGGRVVGATFVAFEARSAEGGDGGDSGNSGGGDGSGATGSSGGGLLLLSSTSASGDACTRVFAMGGADGSLAEVPPSASELVTDGHTLAAGLVLTRSAAVRRSQLQPPATLCRLVQVHAWGVRVTGAAHRGLTTQDVLTALPLDVGGLAAPAGVPVASASLCDPCVLLRLGDGTVRLLTADEAAGELLIDAPPGALGGGLVEGSSLPVGGRFDLVTAVTLVDLSQGGAGAALSAALGPLPGGSLLVMAVLARRSGALTVHALPSFRLLASFTGPSSVTRHGRAGDSPVPGGAHVGSAVLVNVAHASSSSAARSTISGGAPDTAMATSDGGEPCVDLQQENGTMAAAVGPVDHAPTGRKLPRSFITDVAVTLPPDGVASGPPTGASIAPLAHLTVVTATDDVYAYALLPPLGRPAAASSESPAPASDSDSAAAAEQALVLDSGAPLQYSRAGCGLRLARLPGVPGLVTRLSSPGASDDSTADGAAADAEADPASVAAREALWQAPSQPRLIPLCGSVGGWDGLAVLTPRPLWLLAWRGTLVPVPFGVLDVTGAGGAGALPGDALFSGTSVSPVLQAVAPFSSPALPGGVLAVTSNHLLFSLLHRPSWPVGLAGASSGGGAPQAPRRCPYGLLTATTHGVDDGMGAPESVTAAPPPAHPSAVLALSTGSLPSWGGGAAALSSLGSDGADEDMGSPAGVAAALPALSLPSDSCPSYGTVHEPSPLLPRHLPVADLPPSCPGGGAGASGPIVLQSLDATPYHVAYLEGASLRAGAAALREWHGRRVTRAGGPASPAARSLIPPSAPQLACASLPLYACAVSVPTPRTHDADTAALMELLTASGGEHSQVEWGPHIELVDKAASLVLSAPASTTAADGTLLAPTASGYGAASLGEVWASAGLGAPPVWEQRFEVRLYSGSAHTSPAAPHAPSSSFGTSSGSWGLLDAFQLLPGEHVTCMVEAGLGGGAPAAGATEVPLASEVSPVVPPCNPHKAESLLVVGTAIIGPRGEAHASCGRVLVFRVDPSPPAPGGWTSSESPSPDPHAPRLVLLFESGDATKGPVSCIAPLASKLANRDLGHILVGVGRTVQVMEWRAKARPSPGSAEAVAASAGIIPTAAVGLSPAGSSPISWELRAIARHETTGLVGCASVAAGYIVLGDAATGGGLHFLRWREEDHSLLPLARDGLPFPASACEMLIFDKTLSLLGVDAAGNVGLWQYSPKESGNRLVQVGDTGLGAGGAGVHWDRALSRVRLACPVGTPAASRRRMLVLGGASDGSLLATVPLEEGAFGTLSALQSALIAALPQPAGLNPASWRAFAPPHRAGHPRHGRVLDASLLGRWLSLDARAQRAVARAAGVSPARVSELLRALELATAVA